MKHTIEKKEVLVRINSRIKLSQHVFAKKLASRRSREEGRTIPEGEIHREIFDYYISNHK